MIVKNAKFVISCVQPSQYPTLDIPEVAFVGKSNVGKSSLLNALVNRKRLAKIGQKPGVTKLVNFFNIDDVLHFVDLPGYGYASTSKSEIEDWGNIIETYLSTREQLKLIVLLVDIRHAPNENDCLMYNWIKFRDIPHFIIATKCDKISKSKYKERVKEIREVLIVADDVDVIPVSSEKKIGIKEVWSYIDEILVE